MLEDRFTIFAAGLFPGKNKVFMEELCKRFRVITIQGFYFEPSPKYKPEVVEDLLPKEEQNIKETDIVFLMHELMNSLKLNLGGISTRFSEVSISHAELNTFYPICKAAISMAFLFKKLIKHIKIDMVVSNADYSGMRRPIVIEARRHGIPTLNIEHGYFAMAPLPFALKDPKKHSAWFAISDFVNLDNELEKTHWEENLKLNNIKTPVKFIVNGTPNDNSFDSTLTRERASKELKLKADKFNITIAGTWNEAHHPSTIIDGQIAHANYFIEVLKTLKKFENSDFQIIIKLHPAFSDKNLFSDFTHYLKHFLESINLVVELVTNHNLEEIIAVSDLLICPHASSLLWEFFLADVPGITFPLQGFCDLYDVNKLNVSNPLFEKKCMQYVFNEHELENAIKYYRVQENREQYKKDAMELRKKYSINSTSAREKSENICNWMSDYLQKNGTGVKQDF